MTTFEIIHIEIELPHHKDGTTVSVIDFGASTDKKVCNQQPFQQAINHCKDIGASRLIIPKGIYHFHTDPPEGAHLTLDGFSDFTIEGYGSELIFEHTKKYIHVVNSTRIRLADLILDWNWDLSPLASVGVITDVESQGAYFDMKFPTYQDIPEVWPIRIVGPYDPIRYSPGVASGVEYRPYRNEHALTSEQEQTDSLMQELVRELSNIILGMEKVNTNTMRFYTTNADWTIQRIKQGQCYNLRHYEYDMIAIFLFDSSHITVDHVTLYSCPGSGVVGNGSIHHIHMKSCTITIRPGTDRTLSTAADCFHIANSKGYFIIEDSDFSYAGDDCINIHDNTTMGIRRMDDYTLLALRVRRESVLFEVDDVVELRNPDLSPMQFESNLVNVNYDERELVCTLTFKDKLPDNLDENSVLFNRKFSTNHFIIRNNRFTNNRARGILIHGSLGIVEHNIFDSIQGAAIQIESGCESRWSEGTGVHQLAIRNNIFRNCDLNAWQMAVIYMGVYLPGGRTSYPIFHHIWIEDNTIINCPRMAMFLSSCSHVTIRRNAIINSNQIHLDQHNYGSSQQEKPVYNEIYGGVIHIMKASDVHVTRNKCVSTTIQHEHAIVADADSTHNITIEHNVGFN
ncbi:right-handed parallel beta-helix repeat-containing protein [Paenibacillus sp. CMAA1364]